jgi:uncharacterized delta-60 repeat protein
MKRFPAGILLLTLALATPVLPGLHAQETAEQLATEEFGPNKNKPDETAEQLSNKVLGADQNMVDETAADLAKRKLGADQSMTDETAAALAEKEGLETKPKVTTSVPTTSGLGTGEGINGVIYAAAAQADGSVIVGGHFESVNGQTRSNLARFHADGTLDKTFLAGPADGVEGTIYALAIDSKGNILAGGNFTLNSGKSPTLQNFVRFRPDGGLDAAFAAGLSPNGAVYALVVEPKGRIVIGGEFTQVGESLRRNLARFNADGTLDGPVNAAAATTGTVRSLVALQGDRVIAGGALDIAGQPARDLFVTP